MRRRAGSRVGEAAERRWLVLIAATVVMIAVVYPPLATYGQHPLAVFLLPVLVAAATVAWRSTAAIGLLALAAAAVEGRLAGELSGAAYWTRLCVIGTGVVLAVVVAAQRTRREQQLELAHIRAALSDAFQSSLVPRPLPPPHVGVGSRFRPGDDRLQLGGDFFDVLQLRDGSLGYIIGDVCGHGPRAAALGAAIRAGWKTIANQQPANPSVWLTALDDAFFAYGRHDEFVTINTGCIAPGEQRMRYVSAGHPWPVVLGEAVTLERPVVGPPLGVFRHVTWAVSELELEPGTTLLLYTDGLTENDPAHRQTGGGEAALLEHLRARWSGPGDAVDLDALLARFGPDGFRDDVAVLTITPIGRDAPAAGDTPQELTPIEPGLG